MKFLLPALALVLIIASCNPGDPPIFEKTTAQKLSGKWRLQRIESYYYDPIPVLDDTTLYIGKPGDSIVFRSNTIIDNYEDGDLVPDQVDYSIVNDTTLIIDGDLTKIRELTDTRLYLYGDETDNAANDRLVVHFFLYR
jgi:hypothetical protein